MVALTIRACGSDVQRHPDSDKFEQCAGYDIAAPGSLTLEPGLFTTFKASYKPTAAGAFPFDLDVSSDDAG